MRARKCTDFIALPLGDEKAKRRAPDWIPTARAVLGWALAGMVAGLLMVGNTACQKAGPGQCKNALLEIVKNEQS